MSINHKLPSEKMSNQLAFASCSAQFREALCAVASGRERQWAETIAKALDAIETNLRRQQVLAEDAKLWFTEPNMIGLAVEEPMEAICDGQAELLANVEVLGKEVRRAAFVFDRLACPAFRKAQTATPDFGAMRLQAERILNDLDPSQAMDAKLGVAG